MITIKDITKEIKKAIKDSHKGIEKLSVKSKQGVIYITWYDIDTEMIYNTVQNLLDDLSNSTFIELNGVELWRELSNEYKNNNDWTRDSRRKVIKFINKVERAIENKVDMLADNAIVEYNGTEVKVIFTDIDNRMHTVKFGFNSAMSHKKYVQEAINNTGIKIGYGFKYESRYV